jgi:hypothetical protein
MNGGIEVASLERKEEHTDESRNETYREEGIQISQQRLIPGLSDMKAPSSLRLPASGSKAGWLMAPLLLL